MISVGLSALSSKFDQYSCFDFCRGADPCTYYYLPRDHVFPGSVCLPSIHINELTDDILHGRLGHSADRTTKLMQTHHMLDGLEKVVLSNKRGKTACFDDGCPAGKMHKTGPSKQSGRIPKGIGSDLACDIGGPMPVKGLGGLLYFCLLIDLYTRCRFLLVFKRKEDFVHEFRRLLADTRVMERQIGCLSYNLELLIHDRDVVFLQKEMQELRVGQVVPFGQWTSVPYVHCLSIEGEMRWLLTHALAMLHGAGMPFFLWPWVLRCAVYCLNRQYTKTFYNPTHQYVVPWERRFGERTDVGQMIRFGAKTFVYVNKEQRDALAAHAWIGFFVDYGVNSKGWWVYDPARLNVYLAYYILVDETIVYGDIMGAAHARKLKVYKQSLKVHNHCVSEFQNTSARDSLLYQSCLPDLFHPVHHTPLLSQSDQSAASRELPTPIPTGTHTPITTSPRKPGSPPVNRSIEFGAATPVRATIEQPLPPLPTSSLDSTAVPTVGDALPSIGPTPLPSSRNASSTTATHDSSPDHPPSTDTAPTATPTSAIADVQSLVQPHTDVSALRPNPAAHADLSPEERGEREARLESEMGVDFGRTRAEREVIAEDARDYVWRPSDNPLDGLSKTLVQLLVPVYAFFFTQRDADEEDRGMTRRNHAASVIRGKSTQCRSRVTRDFLGLLVSISIAFDDVFAPPTTAEQELSALVFGVHQGHSIVKTGYRDPKTWAEMQRRPEVERNMFIGACNEEVEYGFTHGVYKVRHRSTCSKLNILDTLWVLHMKFFADNTAKEARGRLTIRGDQQVESVDFDKYDLYAPVALKPSVFIVLVIAVQFGLFITRVDITKAFNLGELRHEVVIEVPVGFRDHPKYAPFGKDTVWQVMVASYGLKQAASAYYKRFAEAMLQRGYKRLGSDGCFWVKGALGKDYIAFPIHVDDKIVVYSSQKVLDQFMQDLADAGFQAKVEGYDEILGIACNYNRTEGWLELSQRGMIDNTLAEFDLTKANPRGVPCTPESCKKLIGTPMPAAEDFDKVRYSKFRSMLGVVAYIALWTKPELMFPVSLVSAYMSNPSQVAFDFLVDILLYLKGVRDIPFRLTRQAEADQQDCAVMFSDASLGNRQERRSQSCWLAFFFGNLIAWNSRYQPALALSVAESEFMALAAAGQFACWFIREINELGFNKLDPVKIFSDSQSAVHIAHNPNFNKFTRHIDTRFEWIKQAVLRRVIRPLFTRSASNYSDIGTKSLYKQHFVDIMKVLVGMKKPVIKTIGECEEFEQKVIKSSGNVSNNSLESLSFDIDHKAWIHSALYRPE